MSPSDKALRGSPEVATAAVVTAILQGGPPGEAGPRPVDVILGVAGPAISDTRALLRTIALLDVGAGGDDDMARPRSEITGCPGDGACRDGGDEADTRP